MARTVRVARALVLTSLLAVVGVAHAEPAAAAEAEIVTVDTSRYPEIAVTLDVPGTTGSGDWDVSVTEMAVEREAKLETAAQGGTEVGLVIDTSGSMAGVPMDAAKSAALSFVSNLPAATTVAVVGFGSRPYVVTPMTRDVGALSSAISGLRAQGETALYDALNLAVDQFSGARLPRALILVSDGGDTVSTTSLETVRARLVAAETRLFGVRLATDETDVPVLDGLAAATHGMTVDATADALSLAATYEEIARAAFQQLRVTYRSDAYGPTEVAITLRNGSVEHLTEVDVDLPSLPAIARRDGSGPAAVARATRDPLPLLLGGVALFAGLAYLLQLAFVRRPRSLLAGNNRSHEGGVRAREIKTALATRMEQSLERRGRRQALGARLEQAGMAVRPGEFAVIVSALAFFAGITGSFVGRIRLGVVCAVLVVLGASLLLRARGTKRRATVAEQLPDMLQQLTSSLRAGYGVMQSLDAVAREIGGPIGEELRRVVAEVQLGRELAESLQSLADRVGGTEFKWVVQAIEINREVGGDLVEVIESVAETVRARQALHRQLKALSAEGRLSAWILLSMPFVMAGALAVLSPGYLTPLGQGAGPFVLAFGGAVMIVGWLWLRSIIRIEY